MNRTTEFKQNLFGDVVAYLLIFLFFYTAINKLIDLRSFETTLSLSPYLRLTAFLLAPSIPIIELLIALLLFIPQYRRQGLFFGAILLGIFAVYVGFMIAVSKGLPCTCGGVIQKMSWSHHLLFNIGAFSMSLVAWKLKERTNKRYCCNNQGKPNTCIN